MCISVEGVKLNKLRLEVWFHPLNKYCTGIKGKLVQVCKWVGSGDKTHAVVLKSIGLDLSLGILVILFDILEGLLEINRFGVGCTGKGLCLNLIHGEGGEMVYAVPSCEHCWLPIPHNNLAIVLR